MVQKVNISNFNNYFDIIDQYILLWQGKDSVFKY